MSRQGIKKKKYVSQVLQKKRGLPPEKKNNASKKIAEKKEKLDGKQARKSLKRKKNWTESKQEMRKKKGGCAKKNEPFPRVLKIVFSPCFRSDFHILKVGFAPF
ncbi:MAG: hypothetical protein IKJ25_07195 [Clostridia bacterium]|nr:hypothetical protein [Clostridia bacterium]